MDLAAWYAEGRWVGLLDLIDGLPSASRLNEARLNDPELARLLAEAPEPTEPWSPKTSEYGLLERMVGDLIDEVKQLRIMQSGKPSNEPRYPSPRTAVHAAREQMDVDHVNDIFMDFGVSPDDI